jgi:oxygen-independent coproporphyrinogen-3 oxidase
MTPEYSLYLHIPFCIHRCAYCDFNTYAGQENLIPAYVDALCNELRFIAGSAPESLSVHTIFFGGGTPSLLNPQQFDRILETIRDYFDLSSSDLFSSFGSSGASGTFGTFDTSITSSTPEISLEANPGTVTLDFLRGLRQVGFNRISFGVQSFRPDELRQLERIHDPFDVLDAVRWARQAGFENLNLDLIYGLPGQSLSSWQASLRLAVDLAPQHLSLYALSIESGTPFGRWTARGLLPMPDPDLAADMYEWASVFLEGQGYEQYEISNWSKPGYQCTHNLQYWRNQPYLGFGAGAHGCAKGLRIANVLFIKTYLKRLSGDALYSDLKFPLSPATITRSVLPPYIEMQETLMLGLRLTKEGISPQAFHARFGQLLMDVFGKEIDELIGLGLLEWEQNSDHSPDERERMQGASLRLTQRGHLLGNQVFLRFVGDD